MRASGLGGKRRARGFSLLELLTVIAIIGVLASIAIPSYTSYMVRQSRAAAQSVLLDIAQRQQQFLLDNRGYACVTACTTTPSIQSALGVTVPSSVTQYYTLNISAAAGPPPTFTATASPVSGTRQANDGDLTINQAGVKTPSTKW